MNEAWNFVIEDSINKLGRIMQLKPENLSCYGINRDHTSIPIRDWVWPIDMYAADGQTLIQTHEKRAMGLFIYMIFLVCISERELIKKNHSVFCMTHPLNRWLSCFLRTSHSYNRFAGLIHINCIYGPMTMASTFSFLFHSVSLHQHRSYKMLQTR